MEEFELELYLVSMGNPHAVFFCDKSVTDFPLSRMGPLVERAPVFPRRTNFELARIISGEVIEARIWERGVGETMACGSGAGAIVVASHTLEYTGNKVSVQLPGGTLEVEYKAEGDVIIGGPAEMVYAGKWPD